MRPAVAGGARRLRHPLIGPSTYTSRASRPELTGAEVDLAGAELLAALYLVLRKGSRGPLLEGVHAMEGEEEATPE